MNKPTQQRADSVFPSPGHSAHTIINSMPYRQLRPDHELVMLASIQDSRLRRLTDLGSTLSKVVKSISRSHLGVIQGPKQVLE